MHDQEGVETGEFEDTRRRIVIQQLKAWGDLR